MFIEMCILHRALADESRRVHLKHESESQKRSIHIRWHSYERCRYQSMLSQILNNKFDISVDHRDCQSFVCCRYLIPANSSPPFAHVCSKCLQFFHTVRQIRCKFIVIHKQRSLNSLARNIISTHYILSHAIQCAICNQYAWSSY